MPFCPTIKLHADGHTGPCGKRTQVGGACLEPGCVKHCSKACRVLDNHPPDLVKLAEIAANTKESRGSGATIRLKEAEAKALAAGLTPEQAKKAGIEAGGKQLQSFKKRVSETQGLGASDRYTEAYDAAIESGATEDDARAAGAEAAGEQYMLAKEREFQTRGAGAGSLRSKVEADSLSAGLSESESRERGLVASGPQYQKKTARKLNRELLLHRLSQVCRHHLKRQFLVQALTPRLLVERCFRLSLNSPSQRRQRSLFRGLQKCLLSKESIHFSSQQHQLLLLFLL